MRGENMIVGIAKCENLAPTAGLVERAIFVNDRIIRMEDLVDSIHDRLFGATPSAVSGEGNSGSTSIEDEIQRAEKRTDRLLKSLETIIERL